MQTGAATGLLGSVGVYNAKRFSQPLDAGSVDLVRIEQVSDGLRDYADHLSTRTCCARSASCSAVR